ncbi:hypothetical protein HMPREF1869_00168 [Bacteroidales bacterium KA00251]|nr:hypothetical protein HMPREF1869_00168 [Bacteroidales bacterium KA00251]
MIEPFYITRLLFKEQRAFFGVYFNPYLSHFPSSLRGKDDWKFLLPICLYSCKRIK